MLPYIQTADQELSKLQTTWASQINPILTSPLLQGRQINGVALVDTQVTSVNHGLGRKLLGWFVVGTPGSSVAIVFDDQANNQYPDLTLNLNLQSGLGTATVNLWVY